MPTTAEYPAMQELFAGWFHQDYDLVGDSVDAIVAAYATVSSPTEIATLRAQIDTYLARNPGSLDGQLSRDFDLDVNPSGFASSSRDFLETILEQLP